VHPRFTWTDRNFVSESSDLGHILHAILSVRRGSGSLGAQAEVAAQSRVMMVAVIVSVGPITCGRKPHALGDTVVVPPQSSRVSSRL
jgi:hypothetical protein